jgi:mono/diheme cytochrome c family protein
VLKLTHSALAGVLMAGVLSVPLVAAAAKKPAKPAAGGNAKAGQQAFKNETCTACHKSKDYAGGGQIGPDLSDVGGKKKPAEISAYVAHPKAGSNMPPFKGAKKTLDDLTAYLVTQK